MFEISQLQKNGLPGFTCATAQPAAVAPGGKALPDMDGAADAGAPIISGVTDLTYPDETLSICGEGLTGANLLVWAEGELRLIRPLRTDDSKMQAVVPADMKRSTMILWPVNDKGVGAPYRINHPAIWWSDRGELTANRRGQQVRLFGKGLYLDGRVPMVLAVYSDGRQELLKLRDSNPYQLTAELHTQLKEGDSCCIYVHNGTGGVYGWSQPLTLTAAADPVLSPDALPVLYVDDFGAIADDGMDDSAAIRAALEAAASQGGAVLRFGQGEYNLSDTIEIADRYPSGLYVEGVGTGDYDFGSTLLPSEYDHRGITGTYTVLRFLDTAHVPENIFRITGNNIRLRNMTVFGADGHAEGYSMLNGHTIASLGNNIKITDMRLIKADLRDFNLDPAARLMCSNHIYLAPGTHDVDILGCQFHTKACAIWINHYEGQDQSVLFIDRDRVERVRIAGCDFYGYTSPYVHPDGRRPIADEGEVSRGITAMNCDGIVVEDCRFQGFDQKGCRVLTRSMYIPITANHMYIANNLLRNVGSTPDTGFDGNTGEQILLHGGMHLGGVYNVLHGSGTKMTVRTDNIQVRDEAGNYIKPDTVITNAGSRIQDGLQVGSQRGMAFICGGKGRGQVRQINAYDIREGEITFTLDKPFIIDPDETSIVVQTSPFRENIIFRNTIMKDEPTLAQGFKSGGVLVFFDTYSNIIAENDFRNLAFGVALNTAFKAPIMWCTVRDNTFTGIQEAYRDAMQGGDSTRHSTCFCESVIGNAGESAGWDDYHIWYTVGDTFRNNRCHDCDTGVELATNRWHRLHNATGLEQYHGEEKGNALTVVENNTFTDVADGILVGNPAYWTAIRNNTFSMKEKAGYDAKKVNNEHPMTNFCLLHMEENAVVDDPNGTLNPSCNRNASDRKEHPV